MSYRYRTATPADIAAMPAWRGQKMGFVIIDSKGRLADWPMLATEAEARKDAAEFNAVDDSDERSEIFGLTRMGPIR